MKTMTATAASKEFGRYLDMVQREPVLVTKKNRAVAVTLSMQDAEEFMRYKIETGLARGLDDVDAGRTFEATPENIKSMNSRIRSRI